MKPLVSKMQETLMQLEKEVRAFFAGNKEGE